MLKRFVEYYVGALSQLINSANDAWISEFFKHANAEMQSQFAQQVYQFLRELEEVEQQEWWSVWLKDYWHNRLQGVPTPLDDSEIAWMLEWVIRLPGVFGEAVSIATQMRPTTFDIPPTLEDIAESDLTERYPAALAKLLIHFGQCETQSWDWHGTRDTVDKLLAKGLPTDIETGLRELIAKKGPWMGS